eukprot:CAMPEP_0184653380 /NCGR_PEP_ID=MMETSP0308-20130426/11093_1 /TAXON_ID=38269 /ORGANISM="Gloeochaete witrockiana, Strain SAG 46.84" /LENGTH=398 /DNA_ID=CAMNT_0027088807 /DNA_START=1764 /DNA_END=2960 /DNA_ORIENTATION=+
MATLVNPTGDFLPPPPFVVSSGTTENINPEVLEQPRSASLKGQCLSDPSYFDCSVTRGDVITNHTRGDVITSHTRGDVITNRHSRSLGSIPLPAPSTPLVSHQPSTSHFEQETLSETRRVSEESIIGPSLGQSNVGLWRMTSGQTETDKSDSQNGSATMTDGFKRRLVWTDKLHQRFIDAVNMLGEKYASPKGILSLMSVNGLTVGHVKSHLQKYRHSLKRPPSVGVGTITPSVATTQQQQQQQGGEVSPAAFADGETTPILNPNIPSATLEKRKIQRYCRGQERAVHVQLQLQLQTQLRLQLQLQQSLQSQRERRKCTLKQQQNLLKGFTLNLPSMSAEAEATFTKLVKLVNMSVDEESNEQQREEEDKVGELVECTNNLLKIADCASELAQIRPFS